MRTRIRKMPFDVRVPKTAISFLRAAARFPSRVRGISVSSQATRGLATFAPQLCRGQHEFRARLIIGKFRDDDGVVLSHGQVPGMNLSSRFLCSLLSSVEPCRAFLDFCGPLLGVADQRNEVRHTAYLLVKD